MLCNLIHSLEFFTKMNFKDKYQTYSNTELIRIIQNPENYQPQAVEEARLLISERALSESEIQDAKKELENEKRIQEAKDTKKKSFETKVKHKLLLILNYFNPIPKNEQNSEQIIRLITLLFGVSYLFTFFANLFFFKHEFYLNFKWDFSLYSFYFEMILIPIFLLLFFRKNKIGWFGLLTFLTIKLTFVLLYIIHIISSEPITIPGLEHVFPAPSISNELFRFLFYLGTILVIASTKIRSIYKINFKVALFTFISVVALSCYIYFYVIGLF